MKNGKSLAWLGLAAFAFIALISSDVAGAEESAKDAAESAAPIDWRAFLAPFHSVFLHLPISSVTHSLILEVYATFNPGKSLRCGIVWCYEPARSAPSPPRCWLSCGLEEVVTKNGRSPFHQWTGIAVTVMTERHPLVQHKFGQQLGAAHQFL